ncbi:MAG TPA: sigma-54-dependent Fis family transcriptional regulator, partial [Gammaproteobacteria bacterium]|nr:sigma-54-dependent Fis family transcriptional regulator [Gammaproteobacteria bacterium]
DQTIRLEDLPANYSGNFRAENIPSAATLISPTNMNTASMHLSTGNFNLKDHLQEIELEHIKEALSRSNGVVAAAAKLLNLRRTTLVEKMRKLQIEREEMMS